MVHGQCRRHHLVGLVAAACSKVTLALLELQRVDQKKLRPWSTPSRLWLMGAARPGLLLPLFASCSEIDRRETNPAAKWESGSGSGVGCSTCRVPSQRSSVTETPRSFSGDDHPTEAGSEGRIAAHPHESWPGSSSLLGDRRHVHPPGPAAAAFSAGSARSGEVVLAQGGVGGVRKVSEHAMLSALQHQWAITRSSAG